MSREIVSFRLAPETKRQFFSKLALRGQKAQDFLEQTVQNFIKEPPMESRIYAYCPRCEVVVYREPGKLHGDGLQDTEDFPVWLFWSFANEYENDPDTLSQVRCDCNE